MSIEIKAKHAEEMLDKLLHIINNVMKPSLEEIKKKAKDPFSDAIQQRAMMISDIEKTHTACQDLVTEFAKSNADIMIFIEHLRRDILLKGDVVPKEMFTEQAEIFTNELKPLIERYDNIGKDYFLRKKGE